jgi:hypothetical protein
MGNVFNIPNNFDNLNFNCQSLSMMKNQKQLFLKSIDYRKDLYITELIGYFGK